MSYCTDLNLEFSRVNNSHLFSVRNILERVPCPVRILWWGEKVNFMISRVPTGKCGNLFFSFHVSRNLTAISAVAHLSTRDLPSGTHTLHHVAFTCGLRNVLKWVLFGAKIFSFGGGVLWSHCASWRSTSLGCSYLWMFIVIIDVHSGGPAINASDSVLRNPYYSSFNCSSYFISSHLIYYN